MKIKLCCGFATTGQKGRSSPVANVPSEETLQEHFGECTFALTSDRGDKVLEELTAMVAASDVVALCWPLTPSM